MPKMLKTTETLCKKCKYSATVTGYKGVLCNYLLDTGKRRGCALGVCDKFEARKIIRRKTMQAKARNDTWTVEEMYKQRKG